jgi:CRP-like cAMP-binding protein
VLVLEQRLNVAGHPALAELEVHMVERRYAKGQILYMPGDPGDTLFLLQTGRVQRYHLSSNGRKFVVDVVEPGDAFGAVMLSENRRHHVFAEALDDCVVRVLHRSRVREVALQNPETVLALLSSLVQRLAHAEDKLEALASNSLRVRLARYLVETAENGVVEGMGHLELSEVLGAYRASVTLALSHFRDQGLIETDRKRIKISEWASLRRIAYGERAAGPEANFVNGRTLPAPELQTAAA